MVYCSSDGRGLPSTHIVYGLFSRQTYNNDDKLYIVQHFLTVVKDTLQKYILNQRYSMRISSGSEVVTDLKMFRSE